MRSKGRRAERRARDRKGGLEPVQPPDTTQPLQVPPHIAALAEQLKQKRTSSR
jgi:hypothetical protein